MDLSTVAAAISGTGLLCRGGFHVTEAADPLPPGTRTVVLAGNAGPGMWRAFSADGPHEGDHPLDDWTRRVLGPVAAELGASVLMPSDGPPYPPFQRWALRAEPVHPSPIGPLIHPVYGLWHAYRAALAFPRRLDLPEPEPASAASPCASCAERPCLGTCPVGAFSEAGYDVPACAAHLEAEAAGAAAGDCLAAACQARRACPVGRDYLYVAGQARFHMEKFLAARRRARASA